MSSECVLEYSQDSVFGMLHRTMVASICDFSYTSSEALTTYGLTRTFSIIPELPLF